VTMKATEAELFIRTLRTPKEVESGGKSTPVKFSESKVRRHGRIYKAILKADKENGYFEVLDQINDEAQDEAQKQAMESDGTPQAIEAIYNKINNGASADKQRELRKKQGAVSISFPIGDDDFTEIKKDWESREWGAMSADLETMIFDIGEALDGAAKE